MFFFFCFFLVDIHSYIVFKLNSSTPINMKWGLQLILFPYYGKSHKPFFWTGTCIEKAKVFMNELKKNMLHINFMLLRQKIFMFASFTVSTQWYSTAHQLRRCTTWLFLWKLKRFFLSSDERVSHNCCYWRKHKFMQCARLPVCVRPSREGY